ncbi:hypothetical protein FQN54_001960 [Arachnomyces sp. PD_36]|nr:hypothetical protein FQN54_001960 [Arachnomyces sp. PD_36]
MESDLAKTPFVRELASSDRPTRDKAVESLTLYLSSRRDFSLLELLKVWKGLFFCFYHSDRPLTQQALARNLSYKLVPALPRPNTLQNFLRAFWTTISRDFHSLDRLRLDKYLFLIRCYIGVAFEVFLGSKGASESGGVQKKNKEGEKGDTKRRKGKRKRDEDGDEGEGAEVAGDNEQLDTYLSMMEEGPLSPLVFEYGSGDDPAEKFTRMTKGPDGLRYHILDIWLDELEKVCAEEDPSSRNADDNNDDDDGEGSETNVPKTRLKGDVPMELILRPIRRLQADSPNKIVRRRAAGVLDDDRLVDWGVIVREKESESEDEDEEWGGIE